jgi:hypothetical protein
MKKWANSSNTRRNVLVGLFVALVAGACAPVDEGVEDSDPVAARQLRAVSNRNVGAHCTDRYEAAPPGLPAGLAPVGWANCDRFLAEIKKEAQQEFYYDLGGKAYYWQDTGDGADNSLEDVDLFYSNTHGGAWSPDYVEWGMYEYGALAKSNAMKLGDERRGLSILATYSCHTAEWTTADVDHNGIWDTLQRWDSVFSGGLRAHLSSHGLVEIGGNEDLGKIFAQYLNAGYALRDAWYYGLRASAADNDVAVLFTGANATDCSARRAGMTWDNFDTYPRLKNFGTLCGTHWDDI